MRTAALVTGASGWRWPACSPQTDDTLKGAQIEIDVLVNNAGYGSNGTFLANDLRNQLDMIQVNVPRRLMTTVARSLWEDA